MSKKLTYTNINNLFELKAKHHPLEYNLTNGISGDNEDKYYNIKEYSELSENEFNHIEHIKFKSNPFNSFTNKNAWYMIEVGPILIGQFNEGYFYTNEDTDENFVFTNFYRVNDKMDDVYAAIRNSTIDFGTICKDGISDDCLSNNEEDLMVFLNSLNFYLPKGSENYGLTVSLAEFYERVLLKGISLENRRAAYNNILAIKLTGEDLFEEIQSLGSDPYEPQGLPLYFAIMIKSTHANSSYILIKEDDVYKLQHDDTTPETTTVEDTNWNSFLTKINPHISKYLFAEIEEYEDLLETEIYCEEPIVQLRFFDLLMLVLHKDYSLPSAFIIDPSNPNNL